MFIIIVIVGLVSWIFPEQAEFIRNDGRQRPRSHATGDK